MLPVVASQKVVASAMLWHSLAMIVASIALGFSAELPVAYVIIATILGLGFIYLVIGVRETAATNLEKIEKSAARVFHGSITYLSLLSLALTIFALI
jgi:protoheme IX farnesyltransferase